MRIPLIWSPTNFASLEVVYIYAPLEERQELEKLPTVRPSSLWSSFPLRLMLVVLQVAISTKILYSYQFKMFNDHISSCKNAHNLTIISQVMQLND